MAVALVGRDPEVRQLRAVRAGVGAGRGAVLVIEGEAGIGKSCLVEALATMCHGDGWAIVPGRAAELDTDRPFVAMLEALRDAVSHAEYALAAAVERLRAAPASPGEAHQLVDFVCDAIEALSRDRPVLVAFDDVHWLDDASARVLWTLARRSVRLPILVATTVRPTREPTVLALRNGFDAVGVTTIHLGTLPPTDVIDLASALLGAPAGPGLARLLHDTGGNPLYVTELLRSLRDDGAVRVVDGFATIDAVDLPPPFRHLVQRRLTVLPAETRAVLSRASLLGPSFAIADLGAATGYGLDDLIEVLRPAIEARVIVDGEPGGQSAQSGSQFSGPPGSLQFQHALVQQAIYDDMPPGIRRARHRQVALVFAAAAAPAAQVAEHLSRSADVGDAEAVRWMRLAAQSARPRSLPAALSWLRRAEPLCGQSSSLRRAVQADTAFTLALGGEVHEAARLYLDLLDGSMDSETEIAVRYTLAGALAAQGPARAAEAIDQYDQVLARPDLDDATEADALAGRAMVLVYSLRADEAVTDAYAALDLASRVDRLPARSRANEVLALAATLAGDSDEALRRARAAVADFVTGDLLWSLFVTPHLTLAIIEFVFGTPAASLAAQRTGVAYCERTGHVVARYHLYPVGAAAHLVRGELAEARTVVAAGMDLFDESRPSLAGPFTPALASYLNYLDGDMTAALRQGEQALRALGRSGAQVSSADLAVWLVALVREANGDVAGAAELLIDVWELVTRKADFHVISPDVVRLSRAGHPELAASVAAAAQARAQRTSSSLDRANGLAARGHLHADAAVLLAAADLFDDASWPLAATRTRGFAVELLVAQGQPTVATELLAVVIGAWQRMGAVWPVRRLRSVERSLGIRRRSPPSRTNSAVGPGALTDAERKVALLVAEGLTNRRVAERLFVSRRTIDTHVTNALAKLALTSRVQLAALVVRGDIR